MDTQTVTQIQVGDGATCHYFSDRAAYTVVEVLSPRALIVQRDDAKRTDKNGPYTESQSYDFAPNPNGAKVEITLRANGRWYQKGVNTRQAGRSFTIGKRSEYTDPTF